jgi:hypothetical protein
VFALFAAESDAQPTNFVGCRFLLNPVPRSRETII